MAGLVLAVVVTFIGYFLVFINMDMHAEH